MGFMINYAFFLLWPSLVDVYPSIEEAFEKSDYM